MIDREALEQAIETLNEYAYHSGTAKFAEIAITAYLTALASQEGAQAGEVETLPPEIEEALELFGIEVYELGLKARVGDPDRAKRAAIYNRLTTTILAALTTPPAPDEAVQVADELLNLAALALPYRGGSFYFSHDKHRDRFIDLAVPFIEALRARKGGGA